MYMKKSLEVIYMLLNRVYYTFYGHFNTFLAGTTLF